MKPLFCALLCALLLARVEAAPPMFSPSTASTYKLYASSRDTASFDGEKDRAAREKAGFPMSIISMGEKREREIKDGYATLFATWAQTTLRVPLGWSALDSRENIEDSIVLSPDKTVRIVARLALENQDFARNRDALEQLKTKTVAQTRARLKGQGLEAGEIELLDAPNGAFAVRALNVRDAAGKTYGFIEHFAHTASKTERDLFWAKYDRQEALSSIPAPQALSLLAPSASFEKYVGLFGLMLRDRGLNWSRQESLSPAEFEARSPDAKRFVQVADEAVNMLLAGRVEEFLKRFPEAFEGQTRAQTEKYLRESLIPFLKRLPAKPTHSHVDLTSDNDPQEPFFRPTFVRQFTVGETGPTYVVALERVNGKVQMLGIATSDDPEPM